MRYQCSFPKAPQELHRSFVYDLIELFCIHLAHRVMMMSSCEIDVNKTSSSIFCCLSTLVSCEIVASRKPSIAWTSEQLLAN